MAVLNAKSDDMDGFPSGFSGKLPWKIKTKKHKKNQTILTLKSAFRCCFQFISSVELIPLILKINFSMGLKIESSNVLSPKYTLAIYLPTGIAKTIEAIKILITPKNSVFIFVCFLCVNCEM